MRLCIVIKIINLTIFHLSKWHLTNSNKMKRGKSQNNINKPRKKQYLAWFWKLKEGINMENGSHLFADCVDTRPKPVLSVVFLIASEDVMG